MKTNPFKTVYLRISDQSVGETGTVTALSVSESYLKTQ